MFIVSHPSGNTNVRAVLRALQGKDLLSDFVTTFGVGESKSQHLQLLPSALRREVSRRFYPVPQEKLLCRPFREMTRVLLTHYFNNRVTSSLVRHESGWAAMDKVNRDIDHASAHLVSTRKSLTGVYCYEDCALETFVAAYKRDLLRVYDLPIAYSDTAELLLRQEAERWPQWEQTLGGTRDSVQKRERKQNELELADVVLVPSEFVLRSLPEHIRSQKICYVIPFGSPPPAVKAFTAEKYYNGNEDEGSDGRLRVLFVGTMTQRKGLADLFAAMHLLKDRKDIELICLGPLAAPIEFYKKQYADFRYEARRPHAEVLQLMRSCDVFVLPSILEGRALVQQEAMSCGLPILITPNTGGEDLVIRDETGFVVPIRSPESIAEKLCWFADHRLSHLPAMREYARLHAAKYTWERYGNAVVSACRSRQRQPHTPSGEAHYVSLS